MWNATNVWDIRDKGKVIDGADESAQVLLVVVLKYNFHCQHQYKASSWASPASRWPAASSPWGDQAWQRPPSCTIPACPCHCQSWTWRKSMIHRGPEENQIIWLPEFVVIVHPGLEALLIVVGSVLQGVGGEADEVEVSLHEVQDQTFPSHLERVIDRFFVQVFNSSRTCLSSVETSYFHFDSMMASLIFWRPVPFGLGPQMSITRSIFRFASTIAGYFSTSSLITSNSPWIERWWSSYHHNLYHPYHLNEGIIVILAFGKWTFKLLLDQISHRVFWHQVNLFHLPDGTQRLSFEL